jgi:DNA-binding response OmpR family regulator
MNYWPTILLVEDDPNDVFFFKRALLDHSIPAHVQRVSDGDTAIEYFKDQGEVLNRGTSVLPGMVVLDLCTRGLGAMALLRWIRSQDWLEGLPVVVYSDRYDDKAVAEAMENGANIFIRKECGLKELVGWLRNADLSWTVGHISSPSLSA